ncbi:MAG: hypothetical protein M3292_11050 [Actinomycetota bacterium]|nr:hypothetical protein [Actinomycetota bacterium]
MHRIGAPVALPLGRACPIAREFLVAGGFACVSPLLFGRDVLGRLAADPAAVSEQLRAFLAAKRVSAVVVGPRRAGPGGRS